MLAISASLLAQAPIQNGSSVYNDYLYHNGNIGIGTSSPTAGLHIKKGMIAIPPYDGDILRLQSYDWAHGFLDRLIVKRNGNVGIGTAAPSKKLHVEGAAYFNTNNDAVLTFNNTDDSWQYIQYQKSGTRHAYIGLGSSNELKIVKEQGGIIDVIGNTKFEDDVYINGADLYVPFGNVYVGSKKVSTGTHSNAMLHVNGKAVFKHAVVTVNNWADNWSWPDYVFEPEYELLPLCQVEQHIKANKHLPDIPTAAEVEAQGISLGEMDAKLLKKIEELTLYVIQLEKDIEELKKR